MDKLSLTTNFTKKIIVLSVVVSLLSAASLAGKANLGAPIEDPETAPMLPLSEDICVTDTKQSPTGWLLNTNLYNGENDIIAKNTTLGDDNKYYPPFTDKVLSEDILDICLDNKFGGNTPEQGCTIIQGPFARNTANSAIKNFTNGILKIFTNRFQFQSAI